MNIEPKPYWIKLEGVEEINKAKLKLKFAKDDEGSYIKFKRTVLDEIVPAVKINEIMFLVLKAKKTWYIIEEAIFNRDVKGEVEVICD